MSERDFGDFLAGGRFNAIICWVLIGILGLAAVESLLSKDLLWAFFVAVAVFIVVFPALALGRVSAMPPWEIVALAAIPVIGRAVISGQLMTDVTAYLSVAALALLLAVNLHLFTSVEMSVGFAILFVVIGTLAAAGIWAVGRWISDLYLGTHLLVEAGVPRETVEHELMLEFVGSAVAGLIAGVVFEAYVHRRVESGSRLEEVLVWGFATGWASASACKSS